MSLLLAMVLMLGCVIPYGQPMPSASDLAPGPISMTEAEQRLADLLQDSEDVAQQARLQAARDLLRHIKTQDPQAQAVVLGYLLTLLAEEERSRILSIEPEGGEPLVDLSLPPIQEEVLGVEAAPEAAEAGGGDGGSTSAEAELRIQPIDVGTLTASARIHLEAAEYPQAMEVLSACQGTPCWSEVAELWTYARDGHIHSQREMAEALLARAQQEADAAARLQHLRALEESLFRLLAQYPDTRHTEAIQATIGQVQAELAAAAE